MTLIICCYTPTGIALSGDSRTTSVMTQQVTQTNPAGESVPTNVQIPWVLSDSARKVFCVGDKYAIAAWGEAFAQALPVAHHINAFAAANAATPWGSTEAVADSLLDYFSSVAGGKPLSFVVVGYDNTVPHVYELGVLDHTKQRCNVDPDGAVDYGVFVGGDKAIVMRLLSGPKAVPPIGLMNLQDAVDFSRHLIRTTIDQMRFEPRFATVGGHIDTITATPVRTRFLVRKELHA